MAAVKTFVDVDVDLEDDDTQWTVVDGHGTPLRGGAADGGGVRSYRYEFRSGAPASHPRYVVLSDDDDEPCTAKGRQAGRKRQRSPVTPEPHKEPYHPILRSPTRVLKNDPDIAILRDRAHVATAFHDLWPSEAELTRQNFLDQAKKIVGAECCLAAGEFWASFQSIQFCGEGSFGFVWRCVTFDGDIVAVKAAPIQLDSSAAIDDGFSVIREIASLRCLNSRNVECILPLHAAFMVEAPESLPPHLMSLLRREKLEAEREEKAKKQKGKSKGKDTSSRGRGKGAKTAKKKAKRPAKKKPARKGAKPRSRGGRGRGSDSTSSSSEDSDEDSTDSDVSETEVLDPADDDKYKDVSRFPRTTPNFVGLSKEDALGAACTLIMVTNMCDGDLEALMKRIPSAEAAHVLALEVADHVSAALKEMHRGGMLHLDLKPSNILWRRRLHQDPTPHSPRKAGAKLPPVKYDDPSQLEFFLSDFGNVHIVGAGIDEFAEDAIGTYEYMDTPALERRRCDRHTDSYALGCVLFEIATRGQLFQPSCAKKHQHCPRCYVAMSKKETPHQTKLLADGSIKPSLAQLIRALTSRDRRYRMTVAGCHSAVSSLTDGVARASARRRGGSDGSDSDDETGAGLSVTRRRR